MNNWYSLNWSSNRAYSKPSVAKRPGLHSFRFDFSLRAVYRWVGIFLFGIFRPCVSIAIVDPAVKFYVSSGSGSLFSTSCHCTCSRYTTVVFSINLVAKICDLPVSQALYSLATGMVGNCNEFWHNYCMDLVCRHLRHASHRFCYDGVLVVSVFLNSLILILTIMSSWTMLYGQPSLYFRI